MFVQSPTARRIIIAVVTVAMLCDVMDVFGLRRPRVASAAEQRKTDVTALGMAPLAPHAAAPLSPGSHLPVGFSDIRGFHDRLVTEAEGHFQIAYQDIAIPGPGPALQIRRTYNSHVDRASAFGKGWSWNYGVRLTRDEDSGEPVIIEPDSLRVHFRQIGGAYTSVNSTLHQQLQMSGQPVRIFPDGTRQYFDPGGRLIAIENIRGLRLHLRYNGSQLVEAIDSTGRSLKFTYTGGRITQITDPLGRQWRYVYRDDLLREAFDPLGRRTGYVYLPKFNWRQRLSHVRFPNGADMTVFYHPLSKRVIRLRGPGAMSSSFQYSINPHAREMRQWMTNPRGHRSEIRFEAGGLDVNEPEQAGEEPEMLFLSKDKIGSTRYLDSITRIRDPAGGRQVITAGESQIVVQNPANRTVTIQKDSQGRAAQITDPGGNQTSFSWDASGKVTSISMPGGRSMSFGYEGSELRSVTDPAGNTTRLEPLGGGAIHSGYRVTDASGLTTEMELDRHGYASRVRDPAGRERRFEYDIVGRLVSVTDPAGLKTSLAYDPADNLIEVRDPGGGVVKTIYDEMDNPVRVTDAAGRETTFEYDKRGLMTAARGPGGRRTSYEYDRAGNLVAVERTLNGRPIREERTYDRNHRLVSTTDPLGHAYERDYDKAGVATSVSGPRGGRITFRHDQAGRLTDESYPDGAGMSIRYNAMQQPQRLTHRGESGQTSEIELQYDPIGRPLAILREGKELKRMEYDGAGRLLNVRMPGSEIAFEYKSGEVASILSRSGQREQAWRYAYDAAGRVKTVELPHDDRRTYTFDKAGRYASIEVPQLGQFRFEADASGAMTGVDWPTGGRSEFAYDAGGQIARISYLDPAGAVVRSFAYRYNELGHVNAADEPQRKLEYQYDDASRLTSVSLNGQVAERYGYDAEGNLTQIGGFAGDALRYDAADKLTSAGSGALRYDARGNLIERDGTRYQYDGANRLVRIEFADKTYAAYEYDALGRRTAKNVNGAVTRFVYDGHDIVAELDGADKVIARYVHGPGTDNPLAMWREGKWYYFVADRVGSIRALLDERGQIVESYEYTAYGLPLTTGRPALPADAADAARRMPTGARTPAPQISALHPFGFTGREYDGESGLYFLRSRYYSPDVGRFIQRDPAGLRAGFNAYAYVGGNPVNFRDPLGLTPEWVEELGSSGNIINWGGDKLWDMWKGSNKDVDSVNTKYVQNRIKSLGEDLLRSPHATDNTIGGGVIWQGPVDEAGGKFYRTAQEYNTWRAYGQRVGMRDALSKINKVNKIANFVSLGLDSAFFLSDAYDFYHYSPDTSFSNAFRTLFPSLYPVLLDLLWLIAPVLMVSLTPWIATFGTVLLITLVLITLLEFLDISILNADPTFVQPSPPDTPLRALRAGSVFIGRNGVRGLDNDALAPPVEFHDAAGKRLARVSAGAPPAELPDAIASARHAVILSEPPSLRPVVVDSTPPVIDLALSDQNAPGQIALRLKATDDYLARIIVRAAPEGSAGDVRQLAILHPPLRDEPLLLHHHDFPDGGSYRIEAVAMDLAGNESVAAQMVEVPAPAARPLSIYGLAADVSAEALDPLAEAADDASPADPTAPDPDLPTDVPAEPPATRPAAAAAMPLEDKSVLSDRMPFLPDMKPAWVAGQVPAGAKEIGDWAWDKTAAYGASASHTGSTTTGPSLHYFIRAGEPLVLEAQDNLIQYVYLDPKRAPKQILLQLYRDAEQGEHRVYWGESLIDLGAASGTSGMFYAGGLPAAGKWVRLRIPVERFGLKDARITGMLFGQFDGRALWGPTTKSPSHLDHAPDEATVSSSANPAADLQYQVEATFRFHVSRDALVRLWIEDAQQRNLADVFNGFLRAGDHEIVWDGRDKEGKLLPDGRYTYAIEALPDAPPSAAASRERNGRLPATGGANPPTAVRASALFDLSTLVARITLPANNSLIQATVPFFGSAAGRDFDRYELDHQHEAEPGKWVTVVASSEPQVLSEPPLSLGHRRTVYGNLASYHVVPSGDAYRFDWAQARQRGAHTFRLRVWDKAGRVAEDRVRLRVGDVASNAGPVEVRSADDRAILHIPAFAMRRPFFVFNLDAVPSPLIPPLEAGAAALGAKIVAGPYEARPAGFHFERSARLEVALAEFAPATRPAASTQPVGHTALYTFDPQHGAWRRLAGQQWIPSNGDQPARITAPVGELPTGRAIFAVLADQAIAAPVLLESQMQGRRVTLLAAAEAGSEVTLQRSGGGDAADAIIATAIADGAGLAVFPDVYLASDETTFAASSRDAAGNSAAGNSAVIRRTSRLVLPAEKITGVALEQDGERMLVRASAAAPEPATQPSTRPIDSEAPRRYAAVRVRSESDAEGFWLDLPEEAGTPGRFSASVSLQSKSDPGRALLGIARPDEKVQAIASDRAQAALAVKDLTPPPPPLVTSPSHPVWTSVRERIDAISRATSIRASAARELLLEPVDLRQFPVLSFRYRIQPGTNLHLLVKANSIWHGFTFSGESFPGGFAIGGEKVVGASCQPLNADGQWHQAHLNLFAAIHPQDSASPAHRVESILAGEWRHSGYKELQAATDPDGSFELDQIVFRKAAGGASIRLQWLDPRDLSGISDYSYMLDQQPDTTPPPEGVGKANAVTLQAPSGQATHYFHLRARDGAGNWGPPSHHPLTADAQGPVASGPSPSPGGRSAVLQLSARITDGEGGSGVDPTTIRLSVDGAVYDLSSPALTYEPAGGALTFLPWRADPPLPPWLDGRQVDVAVTDAADFAGNPLQRKLEWSFTVDHAAGAATEGRLITQAGGIEPAWAPDSRRIAYILAGDEGRSLWLLDTQTGESRRIETQLENVSAPAWSPDGAALAVSADAPSRQRDIFLLGIADGSLRNLTNGSGDNTDPAWLPRGEALLFVRDGDLWRISADGAQATVLFDDVDGAKVRRPQISPDGNSVLFWRSLYDEQVWLLDLPTGAARPVIAAGREVDPCFGSKPGQIIYAEQQGSARLIGNTLEGSSPQNLLRNGGWWDRHPRTSPDGRKLVFQSTRNGFWNLWLIEWMSLGELTVTPQRYVYPPDTPAPATTPSTAPVNGAAAAARLGPGMKVSYDARGFDRTEFTLLDPAGGHVATFPTPPKQLSGAFEWTGLTDPGGKLAAGAYLLQLTAYPPGGGDPVRAGRTVVIGALDTVAAETGALTQSPALQSNWVIRSLLGAGLIAGAALLIFWLRRRREPGQSTGA